MTIWIALVTCSFLLALVGWALWAKERLMARYTREQLSEITHQLEMTKQELDQTHALKQHLTNDLIRLETKSEEEERLYLEKIHWLEKACTNLQSSFSALSQQSLQQAQQNLMSMAENRLTVFQTQQETAFETKKKQVQELLDPIRQCLQSLEEERKNEQKQWNQAYGSLHELIKHQSQATQLLHHEARALSQALKSSNVRGVWGEIQLKRVVELAGMLPYCDFQLQTQLQSADGQESKIKRPDLIITLPEDRKLVVDAKAPLKAYLEALESTHESDQKAKLRQHAEQLKAHVHELSQKAYWSHLEGVDFVILFVPGDIFLHQALCELPDLLDWAAEKRVLIATPTSLIALLKACSYSWHHRKLEGQLSTILACGKELFGRLSKLSEHFEELRKGLEKSTRSYNDLVGSWQSRVLTSAQRLYNLEPSQTPLTPLSPIDTSLKMAIVPKPEDEKAPPIEGPHREG